MKTYMWCLFSLVLCACSFASKEETPVLEKQCFNYGPESVALEGQLYRKSFAGPPNYEDITKGDEEEIYWLIKTTKPFCVNGTKQLYESKLENQSEVQLVISSKLNFYRTKLNLLNQSVIVKGSLFPQMTGHHKTEVLIDVEALGKANE
jgi:Domain of unknown function (DUF4431)